MMARRGERLAALAGELGGAAVAAPGDVTAGADLAAAVAVAQERFGRLDLVLANAGFGVGRPVARLAVEDFRRQFETNVFGVLRTLYASLDALTASRGVFAVTGSVTGYLTPPGSVAYAMSKSAVRSLAEGLRAELAPRGVAVTLLTVGFVDSEIRRVDNQGRFRPEYRDTVPRWLSMRTDRAARVMVSALERRRREAVVTVHGKILVGLARHFPRTTAALLARAAATETARRRHDRRSEPS